MTVIDDKVISNLEQLSRLKLGLNLLPDNGNIAGFNYAGLTI